MNSTLAAINSDKMSLKSGVIVHAAERQSVESYLPHHHHALAERAGHELVFGQIAARELSRDPVRAIHIQILLPNANAGETI
jgi:hypothetical protein